MANVLFENGKTIIFDERWGLEENGFYPSSEQQIGEGLFDFLAIDLSVYGKILQSFKNIELLGSEDFSSGENLIFLQNFSPKTFNKHFQPRINAGEAFLENDSDYAESCIYFFRRNLDYDFAHITTHPYIANSEDWMHGHILGHSSDVISGNRDYDLNYLQEYFKNIVSFCFSQDLYPELKELTAYQRLYLFIAKNNAHFSDLASVSIRTLPTPVYTSSVYKSISSNPAITERDIRLVQKAAGGKVCYRCETVYDFLNTELYMLLSMNAKVKKCANCGRYFIANGDYNSDCCDRILPGEKFTCKKIMANKRRKEKLSSNPILKEYERAYKRNYARTKNQKLSAEGFRLWTEAAVSERDKAVKRYSLDPSEDIILDFKKWLGNK